MDNQFSGDAGAHYANIIVALSALIMQAERIMKSEESHPGFNPDKMDDIIKHYADRVEKLRDMRETFESLMNTPTP